jgi:hypothetical protein
VYVGKGGADAAHGRQRSGWMRCCAWQAHGTQRSGWMRYVAILRCNLLISAAGGRYVSSPFMTHVARGLACVKRLITATLELSY